MSKGERVFQLPGGIDRLLATLSRVYTERRDDKRRKLIVNSRPRVQEDREGGFSEHSQQMVYGHTVYLHVPESLYPTLGEERRQLQDQIKEDVNEINNIPDEYVSAVFLEMEEPQDRDWRGESGMLVPQRRTVTPATAERIWGDRDYRVFLSHKAEVKEKAAWVKERLAPFGVSSFVAHTDIHPTKEWQDEIVNALASMDAFVALLTEEFHDSDWTDQEVGYALDRGVPLIAVKLGRDPYGFLGRFQALSCTWDDAPLQLVRILVKQPRMLECYISALPNCRNFEEGNALSQLLPEIKELSVKQAERIIAAFNKNAQLRGSFGFSGEKPSFFGLGLGAHLERITGEKFIRRATGEIQMKKK